MYERLKQHIPCHSRRGRHHDFQAYAVGMNPNFQASTGLATGYSALDAQLQHGGWPLDGTIEVLSDGCGLGAMGLFLSAMECLSEQRRLQLFIAPPGLPCTPLLEARGIDTRQVLVAHPQNRQELLQYTEQALRSAHYSAVFSWLGAYLYRYSELHKLQVAAATGEGLAVLFRANQASHHHSPSGLRLQMREYRKVHLLKQRGGIQGIDVELSPAEDIPQQPQLWELPARAGSQSNAEWDVRASVA